ncbi:MAG: histidine kinase [Clostridia bacterium]|nr:histidine kinase [Clostridia bacterium]
MSGKYYNKPFHFWQHITVILLIPFVLSNMFTIFIAADMSLDKLKTYQQSNLYTYTQAVNQSLNEMMRIGKQFSQDTDVNKFSYLTTLSHIEKNKSQNPQKLYESLKNALVSSSFLSNIYIYFENTDYIFAANYTGLRRDFNASVWYEIYKDSPGRSAFFSVTENNSSQLALILPLESSNGCVVLTCSANDLYAYFGHDNIGTGMIIDSEGKIIFSPFLSYCEKNISELYGTYINPDDIADTKSFFKLKNVVFSAEKLFVNGWKSIFLTQDTELHSFYTSVINMAIWAILISVICWLFVSMAISARFFKAMDNLLDILNIQKTSSKNDNYMRNYFHSAILNKKALENKFAQRLMALKSNQVAALQSQINPHFLFNTLNAISVVQLRLCKGKNDATQMTLLMADLMKAAMKIDNLTIPLSQELELAEKYIEIQKIRYRGLFLIECDYDPKCQNVSIPPMSLQPLLENAFLYSLKSQSSENVIILTTKRQNDNVIITIKDNGKKFDSDKLKDIKNILKASDIPPSGIGLSNVNKRIKLIFGNNYGCDINNDENGTTVSICIPFDYDNNKI